MVRPTNFVALLVSFVGLAAPWVDAHESTQLIGDRQSFTLGPYGAFAAPWSTYPGQRNAHLKAGEDFENHILIAPETFPNNTIFVSRWPENAADGVLGYSHVYYGNYDGGRPPQAVQPVQVGSIRQFTEQVSFELSGDSEKATVLGEFYLTRSQNNEADKAFEIGIFYHASDQATTFLQTATKVGDFQDSDGTIWTCYDTGTNPVGAKFLVFTTKMPPRVVNRLAMLNYLVDGGVISDDLWVNGIGLGVESHGGTVELRLSQWSVQLD